MLHFLFDSDFDPAIAFMMDDAAIVPMPPATPGVVPAVTPPRETSAEPLPPPTSQRRSARSSRQTGGLWLLLLIFILLLTGPFLIGRFVYETTYNELKAGYDVATGTLGQLKPRLNDLEMASRLVAKRVEPSVVSIIPRREPAQHGWPGLRRDRRQGGLHHHEFSRRRRRRQSAGPAQRPPRDSRPTVVGADAMTDIAVLKIDLDNLIAAEWGDSDKLEVGDLVWALGSPYGLDRSLTFGIISAKARRSGSYISRSPYQEYLQTDAAVNPGNSGGPLVNIEGQVVGINAAIFGTAYQGISFSIPSRDCPRAIRRAARQGPHRPRVAGHSAARRARGGSNEVRT